MANNSSVANFQFADLGSCVSCCLRPGVGHVLTTAGLADLLAQVVGCRLGVAVSRFGYVSLGLPGRHVALGSLWRLWVPVGLSVGT
jgi:hypothetical protein